MTPMSAVSDMLEAISKTVPLRNGERSVMVEGAVFSEILKSDVQPIIEKYHIRLYRAHAFHEELKAAYLKGERWG